MAAIVSMIVLRSAYPGRAVGFYQALGFVFLELQNCEQEPPYWASHELPVGLEIRQSDAGQPPEKRQPGATLLEFTVPDLDQAVRELSLIGVKHMSPIQANDECRFVITRDPDGRTVRLIENSIIEAQPLP